MIINLLFILHKISIVSLEAFDLKSTIMDLEESWMTIEKFNVVIQALATLSVYICNIKMGAGMIKTIKTCTSYLFYLHTILFIFFAN